MYLVIGAESTSKAIEHYSDKHLKTEEQKEKILYFNAYYCSFVGKNQRALELINEFTDKYEKSEILDKVYYLKAKTLDSSLNVEMAKDAYKEFLDKFPDSPYAEKVKNRLNELKTFY